MGYHTFSHNDNVLDYSEAKNNSIMILDDVACEKQDNVRSYFCMGRHKNIINIPKHLIRDNANCSMERGVLGQLAY